MCFPNFRCEHWIEIRYIFYYPWAPVCAIYSHGICSLNIFVYTTLASMFPLNQYAINQFLHIRLLDIYTYNMCRNIPIFMQKHFQNMLFFNSKYVIFKIITILLIYYRYVIIPKMKFCGLLLYACYFPEIGIEILQCKYSWSFEKNSHFLSLLLNLCV